MLLLSAGVIMVGTLTPLRAERTLAFALSGTCDLSRIGPPRLDQLRWPSDIVGNVVMFIPLGLAIALVPRSPRKAAVLVGAVALPFIIEATQLLVVPLGRACQGGDVFDNLAGLAIGLAFGLAMGALWRSVRPGPRGDTPRVS
jgi:hypothetical protein